MPTGGGRFCPDIMVGAIVIFNLIKGESHEESKKTVNRSN